MGIKQGQSSVRLKSITGQISQLSQTIAIAIQGRANSMTMQGSGQTENGEGARLMVLIDHRMGARATGNQGDIRYNPTVWPALLA
jgi:hypothetical protein